MPNLITGGWYDYYSNETFRMYDDFCREAPDALKKSHRVLIGPWTHGMNASSKLGQLDYGPEAMKENDHTHRWLEVMLKGGTAEQYQKAPIRFFVMGENVWRDEYEWPLARTKWTTFYLHSGGGATRMSGPGVSRSGCLCAIDPLLPHAQQCFRQARAIRPRGPDAESPQRLFVEERDILAHADEEDLPTRRMHLEVLNPVGRVAPLAARRLRHVAVR